MSSVSVENVPSSTRRCERRNPVPCGDLRAFLYHRGRAIRELASGIEGFIRGIHHWAKPLIFHILHCARSISRPGSRSDQLQKMTVGIAEVEVSPDTVRE